jgi:hypothetical protein
MVVVVEPLIALPDLAVLHQRGNTEPLMEVRLVIQVMS